jgi:hypothetical protein
VLEIGPGWGTMALWLASRGWDVTLADLMPLGHYITEALLEAIGEATGRQPVYFQYDVCGDPIAVGPAGDVTPEPFRLVLMTQVIPHLKWRPDRAIRNIAAMTAPGGTGEFVATVLDRAAYPHVQPPYRHWRDVPKKTPQSRPSREMVVCMYDRREFVELLREGFQTASVVRPSHSTCLFGFASQGATC